MLLATRNQNFMPSLFNELLNWNNWNYGTCDEHTPMPKMNVTESDKNYELELSVPGLTKDDLSLSVDSENNLVIEMVKKDEKKEEKKDRRKTIHVAKNHDSVTITILDHTTPKGHPTKMPLFSLLNYILIPYKENIWQNKINFVSLQIRNSLSNGTNQSHRSFHNNPKTR